MTETLTMTKKELAQKFGNEKQKNTASLTTNMWKSLQKTINETHEFISEESSPGKAKTYTLVERSERQERVDNL